MIRYIKHSDIDTHKWDACIKNAANGLLYGYSFYLNTMAKNWDALVLDDYNAVMPLVWKKKYGIRYLYQPAFTQQLGIFSSNAVSKEQVASFLAAIKKEFRFAEIFINIECGDVLPNYVLPLLHSYPELQKNYSNDLVKNLKIAQKQQLVYNTNCNTATAVTAYRQLYSQRMPQVTEEDYSNFLTLCRYCENNDMLFVRSVTAAGGELLAIALFLKDDKRLYNIMSSVTESGKKCSVNHWLFDNLIKEFSGTGMLLDFEGSVIPGIKKFYENFGPINEPYYFLRHNNLPIPLQWLKKKSNC